jgi:hypothetical protein
VGKYFVRTGQIDEGHEIRKALQGVDRHENPEQLVFHPVSMSRRPSGRGALDSNPRLGKATLEERQQWEENDRSSDRKDAERFEGAVLGHQRR